MKTNELRIGSIIKYLRADLIVKIKIVDYQLLSILTNPKKEISISCHYPIEITEEWLYKLGCFHIEYFTWGFTIDDITTLAVTYAEGKYYFAIRQFDLKNSINMFPLIKNEIKYVHQLQNLYFALTGEELEFKHESKP